MDHQRSRIHLGSVEVERTRQASFQTWGINKAFDYQINLQRQSVIGALKAIYWLTKEDIAHHTKYESLLQLAVLIGLLTLVNCILQEMPTIHYTKLLMNL